MSDFVNNPRRTPRAVIGCDARVAVKDGRFFAGPAHDCGPQGCQLVAPAPLPHDERVFVELKGVGVPDAGWFAGRVAWADEGPPFRLGVQFDPVCRDDAGGFFARLTQAHPEARDTSSEPARIAADAWIAPAGAAADEVLHPGEAEVMRAVGAGLSVRDLRERLGDRWEPCLGALFALLARSELTVHAADPRDPTP